MAGDESLGENEVLGGPRGGPFATWRMSSSLMLKLRVAASGFSVAMGMHPVAS